MAPGDTLPEHQVHSQVHASCTTSPTSKRRNSRSCWRNTACGTCCIKNAIDAQLQEFVKLVRSKSTDFPGPDPTNIKDLGKHEIFMELYGGLQSFHKE